MALTVVDREFPWCFWRSIIRPISLTSLTLANMVIAYSILVPRYSPGEILDQGMPGAVVGLQAVATTLLLAFGFAIRSGFMVRAGLLISVGTWASRAVFLALDETWLSVWLSICWVISSVAAYLLERATSGNG